LARVSFTRHARSDLLDLWTYIASQNPAAANRTYDRIAERCHLLRDHPRLGPARPEIAEGARAIVVERWLVIYRLTEDGAQVVRIVDGARDLSKLDWKVE
jgi:toxin ParE1/3/4